MANNNACTFYPEINGKRSKLYKDLLDKHHLGRPRTNYLYARYTVSNMADQMDNAGYRNRNDQNQHSADDVLKFIDIDAMRMEVSNITQEELALGAVDSNYARVDFTDAKTALEKADNFNSTHNALTAYVTKQGNVYNIIVAEKTEGNNTYATKVRERLRVWDLNKNAFNAKGIDIENMPVEIKDTFSPYNIDLAKTLLDLSNTGFRHIYKKQALILFNIDPNSAPVQRLVRSFGSLEAAADALDALNHGTAYPSNLETLLKRAVAHCQNFQGIDLRALKNQKDQMVSTIEANDPEIAIAKEIDNLNNQFGISRQEIRKLNSDINSLSDGAIEAIFVLKRKIRELEDMKGNNAEGKKYSLILQSLMREVENKRYYSGLLKFLQEAAQEVGEIDNILTSAQQTGTELEKVFSRVKTLREVKELRDMYYNLVSALANENIRIDEDISSVDRDTMRALAKNIKEIFDKKDLMLKALTKDYMVQLMTQIVGNTAPDGQPIANIVQMAGVDSGLTDFLYSIGRASNPVIAAMGSIIRQAQEERTNIMKGFSLRIRNAENALRKAGHDSKFMYEDEGHIISDIDWASYTAARKQEIGRLVSSGLRDFDLKQAIEQWEEQNTEDRIVDTKSGRTEKVPNANYRKAFPNLTQAQKKYYDTMMQIKGEIGTFLPSYAQKHYLPPQLRRSMLDAISEAKNAYDVWKAVKNKIKDLWTVREDDTNYAINGIIDGDELQFTKGAFNNTPLKQIPIFHINRVEKGELMRNFATGITALAGTAINYHMMNSIVDVVEFMGDFVKDASAKDAKTKADVVTNKQISIIKDLIKWGKNNNNIKLVEGFIDRHIYGIKFKTNHPQMTKLWNNLIGYTSFKGLSTNVKGAFSNYLVGEYQMLVEAGAGEFYGLKDYLWAHSKLIGNAGIKGELAELLTNNKNHKATLFRELFDPLNESFSEQSHTKYYNSMFRQLVSHDCSFIGYSSGEYLIHYVNMYGILSHTKVLLNGNKIRLYDAFEVVRGPEGNSELKLKQGVTTEEGNPITQEWLNKIKGKIRYCNQSTHGSMNTEDKGLIHQYWWGRGIMNFRQWMVEHYSRRFRSAHFDDSLQMVREGYWVSYFNALFNEDVKDTWKEGEKMDAITLFMKDWMTFTFRSQAQWANLNDMQRSNIKRVQTEMMMFTALLGLSFALGEPDEHKKEFWRRWWIYQVKRLILDAEASMPHPKAISSMITILQSPMAGIDTLNSLLYVYYGLANGDITKTIQSGPHKGENKYWRNIKKNVLPFFKDLEQIQRLDEDESIFKVFEDSPGRR